MRAEREEHWQTWQIIFLQCPGGGKKCLRGFSVHRGQSSFTQCVPKVASFPHSDPGAGWSHPVPAMQESDMLSTREQDQKGWNSKGPSQAAARASPMSGAGAAVLSPAGMWVTQGPARESHTSGTKSWRCLFAEVWNTKVPSKGSFADFPLWSHLPSLREDFTLLQTN